MIRVQKTNINIFVLTDLDTVNQCGHAVPGELLNVLILRKLRQPSLLLRQTTHDAVALPVQLRERFHSPSDLTFKLFGKGFIILSADQTVFEIIIRSSFETPVLICDLFLKSPF